MALTTEYSEPEPTREAIDALPGPVLLEFGTPWCGHCRAAARLIEQAFARHPGVRHIKVEDASGRPLGRSFRVRIWPTLVFLRDGEEFGRLLRPTGADLIADALASIDPPA